MRGFLYDQAELVAVQLRFLARLGMTKQEVFYVIFATFCENQDSRKIGLNVPYRVTTNAALKSTAVDSPSTMRARTCSLALP
jgi:hypothetical protein